VKRKNKENSRVCRENEKSTKESRSDIEESTRRDKDISR